MLILQIACVIPSHGSLLSHSVTGVCHGNYGMASPVVLVTIPSDENDLQMKTTDCPIHGKITFHQPLIIGVWRTCLPEITQETVTVWFKVQTRGMDERARTDTPARLSRPPEGPVRQLQGVLAVCTCAWTCPPGVPSRIHARRGCCWLTRSVLVESGHGWPELARPGGHGTCLQLAPHCSSGDGLQLLRGCGVLPSLSPNRSRYSWVCRVLARNFCSEAWIGSRWLYGRFTLCSSSDAEQRRSISGAGWETLIIWSRCLATGDLATNSAWR